MLNNILAIISAIILKCYIGFFCACILPGAGHWAGVGRLWQEAGSLVHLWPTMALCSRLTAQEVLLTEAMAEAGSRDRCSEEEASLSTSEGHNGGE